MSWPLWKKALDECKWQLAASAAFLFVFLWLRVWLTSQLSLGRLKMILHLLPEQWERLSPVPFEQIATSTGRIALGYDEPLVLVVVSAWAIARGSDAVSGEIGRGTMELLLAQPVRRLSVLWSHVSVTLLGAAVIAVATWLGIYVGLLRVRLEQPVSAMVFLPAAVNLFALTAFLAALTTLVSSWDRDRWRTLGVVGTIYVLEMAIKVVGRVAPRWSWLLNLSFFSAFEPQVLVSDPSKAWLLWARGSGGGIELGGLGYDAVLLGLAAICYVLASWVFCRRDIPAPL